MNDGVKRRETAEGPRTRTRPQRGSGGASRLSERGPKLARIKLQLCKHLFFFFLFFFFPSASDPVPANPQTLSATSDSILSKS